MEYQVIFEIYYCWNGRFYIFKIVWEMHDSLMISTNALIAAKLKSCGNVAIQSKQNK